MTYFFPGPFILNEEVPLPTDTLGYTTDSGKNALRLAIRSTALPLKSLIAIPAFSCDSVIAAVTEEGHIPYFCDTKENSCFWAEYNMDVLLSKNVRLIMLAHLYGFKHPNTDKLAEFCDKNGIGLIHDAAQSFGIRINNFGKFSIIYSYGAGKSTTAALGGELVNCNIREKLNSPGFIQKINARLFFNQRIFGYKKLALLGRIKSILNIFSKSNENIYAMSEYQKLRALQAKHLTVSKQTERNERHSILCEAIHSSGQLQEAYKCDSGLYFKFVLEVKDNVEKFTSYLNKHQVPFYRLCTDISLDLRIEEMLPRFYETYKSVVEISTERSIPLSEIKRIATILTDYKHEN